MQMYYLYGCNTSNGNICIARGSITSEYQGTCTWGNRKREGNINAATSKWHVSLERNRLTSRSHLQPSQPPLVSAALWPTSPGPGPTPPPPAGCDGSEPRHHPPPERAQEMGKIHLVIHSFNFNSSKMGAPPTPQLNRKRLKWHKQERLRKLHCLMKTSKQKKKRTCIFTILI